MFINSPLTPLLLVACLGLGLGLMGLILTPSQEDPQISVPMVDIFFCYHAASADQVASLATESLEKLMSEIQGVDHVYSASQRDGAMVTVQFDVGEELGPSLVKLNDKIQSNLDRNLPGVSQPMIRPKGVDDVPVVTLTLWSHQVDEAILRSLGLDVLQRLKEIEGTSQSFIVGGRSDAIRVEVFPERLAGFGIGLDQLAQRIRPSMEKLAKSQDSEHRQAEALRRFFERTLGPLLDSRWKARVFRLGMWLAFCLSLVLFYTQSVTVKMLPNDNKPEFNVVVNMPEGTAMPVTANVVSRLAAERPRTPKLSRCRPMQALRRRSISTGWCAIPICGISPAWAIFRYS
jgi:multidrug efflux pump subunit AcrB